MRTMTATEASRNFAAVLTAVEGGEEILVTREGQPVARILPERLTVAQRLRAAMAAYPADPDWAADLERTRRELREFLDETPRSWGSG